MTSKTACRTRGPSPDKTARTRAAIVKAAHREFLNNGFAHTTMAGVAKRAKVAKGTLYLYFKTKEDMFIAMVREVIFDPFNLANQAVMEESESVSDFLKRIILPIIRNIESFETPTVTSFVLSDGGKFTFLADVYREQVYEPFNQFFERYIKLADERGELRTPVLMKHPEIATAPMWSSLMNNGIISPKKPIDLASVMEAQIELCFI
ncbi:hypothetical protein LMG33818_000726 [Halomonadaceae bacterium LMG 33818]|uniref:TetR/AcrR family transcriptional regulator n=1 Tax=Cernens ardua TaxID=3402176 RepID=UPI003EDC294E